MKQENVSTEDLIREIAILQKTIEVQRNTINRLLDTYVLKDNNHYTDETAQQEEIRE